MAKRADVACSGCWCTALQYGSLKLIQLSFSSADCSLVLRTTAPTASV
jgi:hypothetical protein